MLSFFCSSRRLSIDQLTEEAEADLANNNDPNNNSSANEGDYNPVLNEPLNAVSGQPLSSSAVEAAATPLQEVEGESSQSSFIENLYFGSNQSNANAADDEEIDDPYQRALESDIELILKLMPDKAYDEVRCLLESHQGDPKRVQVRKDQKVNFCLQNWVKARHGRAPGAQRSAEAITKWVMARHGKK